MSDRGPRNSLYQRARLCIVSRSFEHQYGFTPFHPNFERTPRASQGFSTSFPLPPTSQKDFELDEYLWFSHVLIHLQTSMLLRDLNPGTMPQHLAEPVTIPSGVFKMYTQM
ncbi:hypothetical protein TNCV_2422301 [Trichonephila clavipes]|nr:hypothetical protein TNCV_2422301 [Trichonephila clavipes]